MAGISTNGKRLFIARHGETIYNKAGRLQGDHTHTPLTVTGFNQAREMGDALAKHLLNTGQLELISSDTDRTLQTLSIIAEYLGTDWHQAKTDTRLREIDMGDWGGSYYRDLTGKLLLDADEGVFATVAPNGENYSDVAARLESWISEQKFVNDVIIISHGMTSRVLRGLLTGITPHKTYQAPIASGLPQGSVVSICDGEEVIVHFGAGEGEKA